MSFSFKKDQRLLSSCLSGDRKASETFVRRFSGLVYKSIQYTLMAKDISFNKYDLEDLHNTIFLQLFKQRCKKIRQYQGRNGCSLASWIRMIAVRTVLDHLRKKGVDTMVWEKKRITLEEIPELKANGVEIDVQIEKAEQRQLLQEGMQRLPPRDRLFMKLHFEQGLAMVEVAKIMRLSIDNTYTVKHRVIQKLKSYVSTITNTSS